MSLCGKWALIGRASIEHQLTRNFGSSRPRIREDDDLESVVQHMIERNTGDFGWSLSFEPDFVRRLFSYGFITIAIEVDEYDLQSEFRDDESDSDLELSTIAGDSCSIGSESIDPMGGSTDPLYVLLPKLHQERCVVKPEDVKVTRSARKKAGRYTLTTNQAFEQVLAGCLAQHGESWLYPPIVEAFRHLRGEVIQSIELWEEDRLVAGELGFAFGQVYTSLTGFFSDSGTGTIQLNALGGALHKCGYALWDLGMKLEYKSNVGADTIPRREFVAQFNALSKRQPTIAVADFEQESARPLLDAIRRIPSEDKSTN